MRNKIFILLGVLVIVLTGCNKIQPDTTRDGTDYEVSDDETDITEDTEQEEPKMEFTGTVTVEPQELFNEGGLIIGLVDYNYDPDWGDDFIIQVENNMDETVRLELGYFNINGYELYDNQEVVVEPGGNSELEVSIPMAQMERSGLTIVGEVTSRMLVRNPDTLNLIWDNSLYLTFQTSAYQDTLKMSEGHVLDSNLVYSEEFPEGDPEEPIMNTINIYAGEYFEQSNIEERYQEIYIENNTDKNINFWVENMKINGEEVTCNFSHYVSAGGKLITDIMLPKYGDSYEPDVIDSIEFSVHIKDQYTYDVLDISDVMKIK